MIYKRLIFSDFYLHLQEKEITILLGPRQTGKTTLLQLAREKLAQDGVKSENIFYFNLDLVTDRQNFRSQPELIRFIKQRLQKKRIFLFVDEAQRIENCGLFFKGVYDLGWDLKIILTGSAVLDLKAKVQESLAGRKKIFYLLPFSFSEYAQTQTNLSQENFSVLSQADKKLVQEIFEEYLLFGGYPKLIGKSRDKKIDYLTDLFSSYVERDIVNLLNIKQVENFIKLVKILAGQTGQILNVQELSNSLSLDRKTIENYLLYLEQTFIVQRVRPFFRNYRKELTKLPKIFFFDLGLRNFSLENFQEFPRRLDKGQILENFIFQALNDLKSKKIFFWRTAEGREIDFIYQTFGGEMAAVEVKAKNLKSPKIGRGFKNFLSFYCPQKAFIVNLSLQKMIKFDKTEVNFCLPFELKKFLTKNEI